jgi:hypothetical protein
MIYQFTSPKFDNKALDLSLLSDSTHKQWEYASSGKSAIYHILKPLKVDKILIPTYICCSILKPIKDLQIQPIFYDLDLDDLNPSLQSIKKLSKQYNIKVILVASMYGNPADLSNIEEYCKNNKIFMIDDAAQSIGAKLNDRYVGTFGDAGFFSISAGKPLAGHTGAFFWSNNNYRIKYKNNYIFKYIKLFYFKHCRSKYKCNKVLRVLFTIIIKLFDKFGNTYNSALLEFEKPIIGGLFYCWFNDCWSFRNAEFNKLLQIEFNKFKLVNNIRGNSSRFKIVLVANDKNIALSFKDFLKENKIYYINGYQPLGVNNQLQNMSRVDNLIFEIPIVDNQIIMNKFCQLLIDFDGNNK